MEKIDIPETHLTIVRLYLEKIEVLNERERWVLIKTIELINNPILVVP